MKRRFKAFLKDEDATITMEFAIVAPLLFTVIIAGFEFFDAFKSHGRAAKVTYTLADILSRAEKVNEPYVTEMHALMNALLPWMNGDKALTITGIKYDADKGYEVYCSKHSNYNMTMDLNLSLNTAVVQTKEYTDILPAIAPGDSIILVETVIPHRTLFSIFGLKDLVWQNQIAIRPRFYGTIKFIEPDGSECMEIIAGS